MEVKISTSKIPKNKIFQSGDSVEILERPKGGLTAILADGQGSGDFAKITSNLVVSKAMSLIADGARDGAAARATHDYLYSLRNGKVSSTLTIISVDLDTRSIVVSRNSNCPVIIKSKEKINYLDEKVDVIGHHKNMKPYISEFKIESNLIIVTFSDGILKAGNKHGQQLKTQEINYLIQQSNPENTSNIADEILNYALKLDKNQANDDMSVIVLGICDSNTTAKTRKIDVRLPI